MNTTKIEYSMDEMRKVIKKQLGLADKIMHLRWIDNVLAINREEAS